MGLCVEEVSKSDQSTNLDSQRTRNAGALLR
jgi:hypothetical protein